MWYTGSRYCPSLNSLAASTAWQWKSAQQLSTWTIRLEGEAAHTQDDNKYTPIGAWCGTQAAGTATSLTAGSYQLPSRQQPKTNATWMGSRKLPEKHSASQLTARCANYSLRLLKLKCNSAKSVQCSNSACALCKHCLGNGSRISGISCHQPTRVEVKSLERSAPIRSCLKKRPTTLPCLVNGPIKLQVLNFKYSTANEAAMQPTCTATITATAAVQYSTVPYTLQHRRRPHW